MSLNARSLRLFFFVPAIALLVAFVVYPVANTIWISFFRPDGSFAFMGNYGQVLKQPEVLDPRGFERGFPYGALVHNFLWLVIHLPLTVLLGLFLASLVRSARGGAIIRSIIFLGMVTPMIVGGVILRFMFDGRIGIVPGILRLFGSTSQTLTAYPDTALVGLILGSLWLWVPFGMVLYSAGLGTIPVEVYEAAMIDGASPLTIFFRITFPLLKPITEVVVVMTFLWDLKIFDVVYAATMGGPGGASNVLALQMYFYAFREFNFNSAAVVATILMVLTTLVAAPMMSRSAREAR